MTVIQHGDRKISLSVPLNTSLWIVFLHFWKLLHTLCKRHQNEQIPKLLQNIDRHLCLSLRKKFQWQEELMCLNLNQESVQQQEDITCSHSTWKQCCLINTEITESAIHQGGSWHVQETGIKSRTQSWYVVSFCITKWFTIAYCCVCGECVWGVCSKPHWEAVAGLKAEVNKLTPASILS